MPAMLRRFSIFMIIVAALLAVEPLLHSHPLQQKTIPGACAVCATAVGRLPHITVSPSAPQVVAYTLAALRLTIVTVNASVSLTSRAPPAQ
jgi:hypothetical protein